MATIGRSAVDAARGIAIREFNRFPTTRLGLLRKRHLRGEFSLTEARVLYEIASTPDVTATSRAFERLPLDAALHDTFVHRAAKLTRDDAVRLYGWATGVVSVDVEK